jgi:hypothetical protein
MPERCPPYRFSIRRAPDVDLIHTPATLGPGCWIASADRPWQKRQRRYPEAQRAANRWCLQRAGVICRGFFTILTRPKIAQRGS